MPRLFALLSAGWLLAASAAAFAQSAEPTTTTIPDRCISMEQVEQRFGAPNQMFPPVGDPPISRWVYNDFTVYFEYDLVVHTVNNEIKPRSNQ